MDHEFKGQRITIRYDDEVCQHAKKCLAGLPAVFDGAKKPWINPDGASVEEAIATIKTCPSGALRYELQ